MTVEERRRRRFSESFRREQVLLIESGKLSLAEVSRLYEVKKQNVRRWLQKYGNRELPGTIIVTNTSDYDRIGKLEMKLKELKQIIGEQQILIINQSAIIELAEGKLGKGFEKK